MATARPLLLEDGWHAVTHLLGPLLYRVTGEPLTRKVVVAVVETFLSSATAEPPPPQRATPRSARR